MRASSVRDILLAHAIETAAPNEALPSAAQCEAITQDTLHAIGNPEPGAGAAQRGQFLDFLAMRAQRVVAASHLPHELRKVWRQAPGIARWVPFAVLAGALVIGFCMHRFTDPHRVDLLAPSLLAIVLWNLLVYAWMLAAWIRSLLRAGGARAPVVLQSAGSESGQAVPSSATEGWRRKLRARLPVPGSSGLRRMALSFERNWWQLSRRARHAQWLSWLHLGAALMAAGALASLWMTGLTNEYQVGWESTFLSAPTVHGLLNLVFAPVRWLLGTPAWSLADIEMLRGWVSSSVGMADAPGRAPPASSASWGEQWVIAYTALLGLLVIAPRLGLGLYQGLRAWWLGRHMQLPLSQPYFKKLQRDFGGLAITLHVLPYSFEVTEARRMALQHHVSAQYGAGAHLVIEPALAYGAKLPSAASVAGGGEDTAAVLLINMAATPEPEIHGELLQAARERWGRHAAIWLWSRDFDERNAGAPKRMAQRREVWNDFVRNAGLCAVWIPESAAGAASAQPADKTTP